MWSGDEWERLLSSEPSQQVKRNREAIPWSVWRLAAVLAFGGVMGGLDSSIVNVGLATIGDDLSASLPATQWVASGYLLALAAALPCCAWLCRRWGAGRLWLWSLAGFTVASALCGLAPTLSLLIAARVLQGVAGGLLVPAGMALLAQSVAPAQLGRVLATSAVPAILAPAVGPVLGAVLIAHLSWLWLFVINVPIGLIGLVLGRSTVRGGERVEATPLDGGAVLLIATGLPLLVYGLSELAARRSLLAPTALLPVLAGLAALSAFARRSLRSSTPLLDLRLFRDPVYRAATLEVLFNGAALFGGLILMPLYFQLQLGRGIVDTGLLLITFSVGAAATFPIAGRLTDRWGGARVATVGLVLTALSTAPFVVLPASPDLVLVEALQLLRGIGLALSGMPIVSTALATVARHQAADASTQINIMSRVGGAAGGSSFVVVLTSRLPLRAVGAGTAGAFHTTFALVTAATLGALLGARWLQHAQQTAHRATAETKEGRHR